MPGLQRSDSIPTPRSSAPGGVSVDSTYPRRGQGHRPSGIPVPLFGLLAAEYHYVDMWPLFLIGVHVPRFIQ